MTVASTTPAYSTAYPTTDATGWLILESEFNSERLHHQETVFTIGNGYLGTRGTFEEGYPGDQAATLIHGLYDAAPIVTSELVNCPSWLSLTIRMDGEPFRLDTGEILQYDRRLNLRVGLLTRTIHWRSPAGHEVVLRFERFCSYADQHILVIRCHITSINFTGAIEIESSFEKDTTTVGVPHWKTLHAGVLDDVLCLSTQTLQSELQLGSAARLHITNDNGSISVEQDAKSTSLTKRVHIQPESSITVEKIVAVYTSRETELPLALAWQRLSSAPCYRTLFAAHITAWALAWQNSDIVIEGDLNAQVSARYNVFQLLIAAPRQDDRVSIPAKTLSGLAYRGHVFWDTDIFIAPVLTLTQPNLARNLLTYRYHTLAGARRKAKEAGFEGAMYAWESAGTGDEVTPRWVPGPKGESIRIWCGDIEVHINADVAYAAWHYWQRTGDDVWMRDYGAEIILDTAKFWASRVEWNPQRQCYELNDVIGPDENHDRVNNNAFTNVMVQWHFKAALTLWDWLVQSYSETASQLQHRLDLTVERFSIWATIAEKLHVNFDPETRLIEQFDGFFDREDVNLEDYEPRTRSMQALLGIEATNQKQILKQADVLMLMYLLREQFDHKTIRANWEYYTPRTDHSYGSSLGPAIQSIIACDLDQSAEAYHHFIRAAMVDIEDVRGNASEGIHAASAGGVWQAIVFGFGGIRFTDFGPIACPSLPPGWERLKFRIMWRNQWYEFDLTPHEIALAPVTQSYEVELSSVLAGEMI
jgi:kojibiose phosphorylase